MTPFFLGVLGDLGGLNSHLNSHREFRGSLNSSQVNELFNRRQYGVIQVRNRLFPCARW